MPNTLLLSYDDVMIVRRRLAGTPIAEGKAFGETEPLHPAKLDSAVNRQNTGFGGKSKYNTPYEIGATLFYGINMAHAFENGNKRTALVSLLVFLDKNKIAFVNVSEDDLYQMTTQVAAHTFPLINEADRDSDSEVEAIAQWIESRTRALSLGDRAMKFADFRGTLEDLGAEFDSPKDNFIKIRLASRSVSTGYPKANFDLPVKEIKRIRKALLLDEASGFDSAAVYDLEARVPAFANKYRQLLARLSEV